MGLLVFDPQLELSVSRLKKRLNGKKAFYLNGSLSRDPPDFLVKRDVESPEAIALTKAKSDLKSHMLINPELKVLFDYLIPMYESHYYALKSLKDVDNVYSLDISYFDFLPMRLPLEVLGIPVNMQFSGLVTSLNPSLAEVANKLLFEKNDLFGEMLPHRLMSLFNMLMFSVNPHYIPLTVENEKSPQKHLYL